MASAWGLSWGKAWGNAWGLLSPTPPTTTKNGGDDAFHPNKHTGWNKEAWRKKHLRDQAIDKTIEEAYQRILGIAPKPEIVAEIKKEAPVFDYTQEVKFIEWLSLEIEQDEEEAILLLLI